MFCRGISDVTLIASETRNLLPLPVTEYELTPADVVTVTLVNNAFQLNASST